MEIFYDGKELSQSANIPIKICNGAGAQYIGINKKAGIIVVGLTENKKIKRQFLIDLREAKQSFTIENVADNLVGFVAESKANEKDKTLLIRAAGKYKTGDFEKASAMVDSVLESKPMQTEEFFASMEKNGFSYKTATESKAKVM